MSDEQTAEIVILSYAIPVAPKRDVLIQGPFPITEDEWTQLVVVLDVMKSGLVVQDRPALAGEQHG